MKICTKCKIEKSFNEFNKMKSVKSGLRPECKSCRKIQSKDRYLDKKDHIIFYQKEYEIKNREEVLLRKKEYYQRNTEKFKTYNSSRREVNRIRENKKNKENPAKSCAKSSRRRATMLRATLKWLTKEHWDKIDSFYVESARLTKETGIPHEVDHIIPLLGKNVRGLHVPWNLQILTASENASKGNK